MSQDLKKELIKLGNTNPALRPHIRPILDKVAANVVVVEGPEARIEWTRGHAINDYLRITEKPASTQQKSVRTLTYSATRIEDALNDDGSVLFSPLYINQDGAKFHDGMNFNQAKAALLKGIDQAEDTLQQRGVDTSPLKSMRIPYLSESVEPTMFAKSKYLLPTQFRSGDEVTLDNNRVFKVALVKGNDRWNPDMIMVSGTTTRLDNGDTFGGSLPFEYNVKYTVHR